MITKKQFKQALGAPLQEAGFISRGQSWYLASEKSIVMIGAEKSSYDEKYWLDFGVWLKGIEDNDFPKSNHCHIQDRLDELFPNGSSIFEAGCSLERGSQQSLDELALFLRTEVVPFCIKCLELNELMKFMAQGRFSRSLVMRVARDVLLQK
jgi:hypothetical protein